ncbi:MAG TPA: hypothetical protein PLK31_06975 [Chloroflexota bacterium]|nr:hypothetical protein [Chloroflexota bacterium]
MSWDRLPIDQNDRRPSGRRPSVVVKKVVEEAEYGLLSQLYGG